MDPICKLQNSVGIELLCLKWRKIIKSRKRVDYLYRVLVGTTKNEPHMQENFKSRKLNNNSVVICLFYKAVSPELFKFTACLFWNYDTGISLKGYNLKGRIRVTCLWKLSAGDMKQHFPVKLAGTLQQVPGIVNVASWKEFVCVHADPAMAALPDNQGSVWGEEVHNSHSWRYLPHGSNTRELCQVPWKNWHPTHAARISAYCFFPYESKATWDSGSSQLDS